MAITNKLITFNKLTSFETQLAQGNILETSIVFIKDAKKIWTKGTYFDCSGGGSNNIAVINIDCFLNNLKQIPLSDVQRIKSDTYTIVFIYDYEQSQFVYVLNKQAPMEFRGLCIDNVVYRITIETDGTVDVYDYNLALKSDIPNTDDFATQANLTSAVAQLTTNIAKKQDKLVSGTNIATINNSSILGSGNFDLATSSQLRDFQPKLVSGTSIKTINGESILGSGDIAVQGGGDNRYFTEFTVSDFINACKNESSLVSNGLCDAIINNKIICVPYSLESYDSGYIIASCNYGYSEVSTEPYSFSCLIERNQITYELFSTSSVVNNDAFWGTLPTSACPQVVYLDSWIADLEDNTTYIMNSGIKVNDLFVVGSFSRGVTIRFITGDNPSLEFAGYYVFWANGVIPEIEPNTWYELSLTTTSDGYTLAVLTPFKSV